MSWKTVNINSDLYTYDYFLEELICRICWSKNGEKEITSTLEEDGTRATVAERIIQCTGVDLSINTRPTKICSSCWDEIQNFNQFKSFCHKTQTQLCDILQNGPQNQKKLENKDSYAIEDYEQRESYEYSEFENSIDNLFGDLNTESDERDLLPRKKSKKIKTIKSETYCTSCKIDLGSQDCFTKHNVEIHSLKNGLYKCFGCERSFKHKKGCVRHETEHCKVLKNGYKCKICKKVLQKRCSYEHHLRAHRENNDLDESEEVFQCKKCVNQFISRESLNEHKKIHEEERKNWVCDTCGRVFNRRDYLYKHKLIHEGRKLYSCPHCNFRTIQKSSLNVHIRKHTGERPYACALCPQRCVNSSNLHVHMKRHLGIKRFECHLCDKKFGYKISLEEHISSTHERSEVHSCDVCGATYSQFRGLKRHLASKHGKLLVQSKKEIPIENQEKGVEFEH